MSPTLIELSLYLRRAPKFYEIDPWCHMNCFKGSSNFGCSRRFRRPWTAPKTPYSANSKIQGGGKCPRCHHLVQLDSLKTNFEKNPFDEMLSASNASRIEHVSKISSSSLKLVFHGLFSMPTKDLSCLLVGETSQGRSSDERKEALIHLITIKSKSNFK